MYISTCTHQNCYTCFLCLWHQFEETHALDCVCPPCSTKYKGSSPNNSHTSTKYQQFVDYNSYYTLCESKQYLKGSTHNRGMLVSEPNQAKPSLMSRRKDLVTEARIRLGLWKCSSSVIVIV